MPLGRVLWAVALPQGFFDGPVDMGLIREFAVRAEAQGYHSLWVQDHNSKDFPTLDPVSLLTYVAALTERVRLGTAVLVSALRHPIHLATALASLDVMSGGRVIAGIGLGAPRAYEPFGVSRERCVTRFREGIELMRSLWTEPVTNYRGEFWQARDYRLEAKPLQKPFPLWFGARHPNAIRRAVRYGNGFIGAGSTTIADFRRQVETLRQLLAEAGRAQEAFPIAKRVYLHVDRDDDRAEAKVARFFRRVYGPSVSPVGMALWGTPEAVARGINEIIDAGAEIVILNPVEDHLEQLEALREVVRLCSGIQSAGV